MGSGLGLSKQNTRSLASWIWWIRRKYALSKGGAEVFSLFLFSKVDFIWTIMIGKRNTMGCCSQGERLGSTQTQQGEVEIYCHRVGGSPWIENY